MSGLVTAITTGATAFSATNFDDIVILILFFSQVSSRFRPWHIVVGQYLGFSVLVIASIPGFFGSLIIPEYWIGRLGLVPIAIGLSSWINREEDLSLEVSSETGLSDYSTTNSFLPPQTYSVAAITIANGGDNIGVYVPLFASSTLGRLIVIIGIFFLLVGVWCYAAYKLTRQPAIADILTRYGNNIMPFVLIGLGIFIVLESNALTPLALVASCLCLMVLVRNDESSSEGA